MEDDGEGAVVGRGTWRKPLGELERVPGEVTGLRTIRRGGVSFGEADCRARGAGGAEERVS